MSTRTTFIGCSVAALLLATACSSDSEADTDTYPENNIDVVVPVPAGSSADLTTRIVADCLESELDTTVLVENRDGGSGSVGNTHFTQADPDGYTLVATTIPQAVIPSQIEDGIEYEAESFLPVGTIGHAPIALIVGADSPYETAEEFMEAAENERLLVGAPGATSVPALVGSALTAEYDQDLEVVPFDGNANTLQGVRSGDVDGIYVAADAGVILPAVENEEVRVLAVTAENELAHLPNVPTMESLGYSGPLFTDAAWSLFLATQPETSEVIVETLEGATRNCMESDAVRGEIGEEILPEQFIDGGETLERLLRAQDIYGEYATSE